MVMTMRRTRHKLEPQCVHKESSTDKENIKTQKRHHRRNKLHSESSVAILVSVHMLQVCGHIKHVVVLVVLLCVINSVVISVPTVFTFHLYVNSL